MFQGQKILFVQVELDLEHLIERRSAADMRQARLEVARKPIGKGVVLVEGNGDRRQCRRACCAGPVHRTRAARVDEAKDHVEIGQIFDSVERKWIRNIDLFQIRMQVTALGYKSMRQLAGVTVEGREPD